MTAVEQLVEHWTEQGLPLAKGVPDADIESLESRYALTIPTDLRDYFKSVNGHVQRGGVDTDAEGFAFWPLERLQPLPVVCAVNNIAVPPVEGPERYFVFADYLQWSWAYAIRFGTTDNPVIFVGAVGGQVATSFAEFVRLDIEDSQALYPGAQTAD